MLDDVAVEDTKRFESELSAFIENSHPSVLETLRTKKSLDDDLKASLKEAVEDFKSTRWAEKSIVAGV